MRRVTYRDRYTGAVPLDTYRKEVVGARIQLGTVEGAGGDDFGPPDGEYLVIALDEAPDQLLSGGLVPGVDVFVTLEEVPEPEAYRLAADETPAVPR